MFFLKNMQDYCPCNFSASHHKCTVFLQPFWPLGPLSAFPAFSQVTIQGFSTDPQNVFFQHLLAPSSIPINPKYITNFFITIQMKQFLRGFLERMHYVEFQCRKYIQNISLMKSEEANRCISLFCQLSYNLDIGTLVGSRCFQDLVTCTPLSAGSKKFSQATLLQRSFKICHAVDVCSRQSVTQICLFH